MAWSRARLAPARVAEDMMARHGCLSLSARAARVSVSLLTDAMLEGLPDFIFYPARPRHFARPFPFFNLVMTG